MSTLVIDVGERDFETAVIARSAETPVVVDFWAPWCGPCRTLGPLLERLSDEQPGAFVLAKVNVDENPELSAALNIQSIPMVLGFRDRQIVAEFVGAVPEAAVREFLKKVLPSDAECLAASAEKRLTTGDVAEAERAFEHALQLDTGCERALLGLARIHADRSQYAEASALLERLGPGPWRQPAERLAAEIRIREAGGGDEQMLRAKLAENPADLETRFLLGQGLAAAAQYVDALDQYLEIVRRDRTFRDGAARQAMLEIFNLLGSGNEIADHYRSELAKVLFS
jgi:putative thioredoxin